MSDRPDLSYIVPCYGCRRTVGRTIRSLQAQDADVKSEIIVVDSSPTPVRDWIRTSFPRVVVLESERRLWPGAARNRGAEAARAPVLAFLDADAAASTDWARRLLERLDQADVVAAGGSLVNGNPHSVASRVQYWIEFSEFLPGTEAGFRKHLSASNLLVRRTDFDRGGGFPEELGMSEDTEFSRRIGSGLFFEPAARIEHLHRSRWSEMVSHLWKLGYWSAVYRVGAGATGSGLKRLPPAALFLPPVRLIRILKRVGAPAVPYFPLLLAALVWWALGFRRGLMGKVAHESPRI